MVSCTSQFSLATCSRSLLLLSFLFDFMIINIVHIYFLLQGNKTRNELNHMSFVAQNFSAGVHFSSFSRIFISSVEDRDYKQQTTLQTARVVAASSLFLFRLLEWNVHSEHCNETNKKTNKKLDGDINPLFPICDVATINSNQRNESFLIYIYICMSIVCLMLNKALTKNNSDIKWISPINVLISDLFYHLYFKII